MFSAVVGLFFGDIDKHVWYSSLLYVHTSAGFTQSQQKDLKNELCTARSSARPPRLWHAKPKNKTSRRSIADHAEWLLHGSRVETHSTKQNKTKNDIPTVHFLTTDLTKKTLSLRLILLQQLTPRPRNWNLFWISFCIHSCSSYCTVLKNIV